MNELVSRGSAKTFAIQRNTIYPVFADKSEDGASHQTGTGWGAGGSRMGGDGTQWVAGGSPGRSWVCRRVGRKWVAVGRGWVEGGSRVDRGWVAG